MVRSALSLRITLRGVSGSLRRVALKRASAFPTERQLRVRWFSSGERLRVAVVGGGCAGMSSALHLAPLVDAGMIHGPIDVYDIHAGPAGREVGVGIWSTAIEPFRGSNRPSHEQVWTDMTMKYGNWLGNVGYRTPSGAWLTKSRLPMSLAECDQTDMPFLLFLREKDMLGSLYTAVQTEEEKGTIDFHNHRGTRVEGLFEESTQPWSTNLLLNRNTSTALSERDYHLIIAADGTHSVLRKTYGGHDSVTRVVTGTSALPSPIDLPSVSSNVDTTAWNESQQQEAVALQDRQYTVFRGNGRLTNEQMGENGVSFQIWGKGRSMRFATVPMLSPGPDGKREEVQVWFITIDGDDIALETDPAKRRAMLLEEFKDWYAPVCKVVEATPPEEILMERAIAHRHSMGPVLNFNQVVKRMRGTRPPSSGEGPCIVFAGDAYMTVDPILAQGFTVAMEGAANLRKSVEDSFSGQKGAALEFDPMQLRQELKKRRKLRIDRLICLLRATELVQALGQPSGGTISGALNTKVLRPLMRLVPNFIKAPIFSSVLKYSLGLGLARKRQQQPTSK